MAGMSANHALNALNFDTPLYLSGCLPWLSVVWPPQSLIARQSERSKGRYHYSRCNTNISTGNNGGMHLARNRGRECGAPQLRASIVADIDGHEDCLERMHPGRSAPKL